MSGWRSLFANSGAGSFGVPSTGPATTPGTAGGQNAGQLEPNSRMANMAAGVPYQLVPAYPPFVRIANDPNILYFPRFRTLSFFGPGTAANATATGQYQFQNPTIILARTAAAFLPTGTALDVGRNSLDTFRAQMFRTGAIQDFIDAGAGNAGPNFQALGSTIFGTAQLPALIPGTGVFVDTGGFLNVNVTALIANVTVDITIWCIEEYGPARG